MEDQRAVCAPEQQVLESCDRCGVEASPGGDDVAGLKKLEWEEKNEKALGLIGCSIDVSRHEVAECETAKAAWDLLKERYDDASIAMMTALTQQFYRMTRKRDEPLEAFVDRLKDVAHRLEGSGCKVEEMDKTMVLLSSAALEDIKTMVLCTALQARWSAARTPEEATKLLSFDSAVAQLVNGVRQAISSAFFTCWGCQKLGHKKDQCPNLKEVNKILKDASEHALSVRVKEQETRDQIQGLGRTYHFQN